MSARQFSSQRVRGFAAAALLLALVTTACGDAGPNHALAVDPAVSPSAPGSVEPPSGSVRLLLEVEGDPIESANYAIVGAGFSSSGTFDVSNSTSISGIVGGVPFGDDYAVTLNAVTVGLSCEGSASFQISSTQLVSVDVPVRCRQRKPVAAAPAPVPPLASGALGVSLLALGIFLQRRSARRSV